MLLSHVLSQQGFHLLPDKNDAAGAALKKAALTLGSGQQKNRLRLRNTAFNFQMLKKPRKNTNNFTTLITKYFNEFTIKIMIRKKSSEIPK